MDYSNVSLISQSVWLSLSQEMRQKIARLFKLSRSGTTITNIGPVGGVIQSDGYTPQDLMPISVTRMQGLLGSESKDYYHLFNGVVENIDSLLDGTYPDFLDNKVKDVEVGEVTKGTFPTLSKQDEIIPGEVKIIKKRGRPKKHE